MITEALQHFPGIGPVRLALLHESGIRSWHDVLASPRRFRTTWYRQLADESRRCLDALAEHDIHYLVDRFAPRDKWRILAEYFEQTSYFDIETAGLEYDAPITTIVCWHEGELRVFVEHENLDDFLDLLDEITLLVSFNGSSFDVPRVLDSFHVPELPCPHIDLRWLCYHDGHTGGLKEISTRLGISRPADLLHADGELAIRLWNKWMTTRSASARGQLIRYCAADVLLLVALADRLTRRNGVNADELWSQLPAASVTERVHTLA